MLWTQPHAETTDTTSPWGSRLLWSLVVVGVSMQRTRSCTMFSEALGWQSLKSSTYFFLASEVCSVEDYGTSVSVQYCSWHTKCNVTYTVWLELQALNLLFDFVSELIRELSCISWLLFVGAGWVIVTAGVQVNIYDQVINHLLSYCFLFCLKYLFNTKQLQNYWSVCPFAS